ncbi:MAG: hypothetical protein AABX51_02745 [Nanoarchaeota archaeon]
MKKFIVIAYAPFSAVEMMSKATPEQMKKSMEPWMKWMNKVGSALVDMGTPLGNGQNVSKKGNSPSKKNVAGYMMIQAEDMKKALSLVKNHPHLDFDAACEIEVYECMPM